MSDEELDPEVVADLRLRASTEQDRSRSRTARYDWAPAQIIGQWRCRNPKCAVWVPVTVDAMEAFALFNQQLRSKGEYPLEQDSIVFCDECRVEFKRTAADRRRGQVERMRVAIIELKQTKDGERQREIVDQLRVWGHPDVDGLVNWLRERDKASGGKKRREL